MKTKGVRLGGTMVRGDVRNYIYCKTHAINAVTWPIKTVHHLHIPSADNIFGKCIPTTGVDVEDIEK